jgi:hypothetical protein
VYDLRRREHARRKLHDVTVELVELRDRMLDVFDGTGIELRGRLGMWIPGANLHEYLEDFVALRLGKRDTAPSQQRRYLLCLPIGLSVLFQRKKLSELLIADDGRDPVVTLLLRYFSAAYLPRFRRRPHALDPHLDQQRDQVLLLARR